MRIFLGMYRSVEEAVMKSSLVFVIGMLSAAALPAMAAVPSGNPTSSQSLTAMQADQADVVKPGNLTGVCDTQIGCGLTPLDSQGTQSEPVRVGNLTGVCDTQIGCGLAPLNAQGAQSESVRVGNLTGVCDTALGCNYGTPAP